MNFKKSFSLYSYERQIKTNKYFCCHGVYTISFSRVTRRFHLNAIDLYNSQALRMDLGHGMIQNPAAEVSEVVEYLVACEKTLGSLYTLADCLISWQARN